MVEAMKWIDAIFLVVGTGDVIKPLRKRVEFLNLSSKIIFTGKVPFEELISYTKIADVGVTLDKDTNLNYKYSLPNKLFDYIQADLPVIASDLIEVRKIIEKYNVGLILSSYDPEKMAQEINNYLNNNSLFSLTKKNVEIAKKELVWENEKQVLIDCYKAFE
jgi:glycosyltransferase involved in cell wall biosynthesis